jgi:hypothetical protein
MPCAAVAHKTSTLNPQGLVGHSEDRADRGGSRINPHVDMGADSNSAIRELKNKKKKEQRNQSRID